MPVIPISLLILLPYLNNHCYRTCMNCSGNAGCWRTGWVFWGRGTDIPVPDDCWISGWCYWTDESPTFWVHVGVRQWSDLQMSAPPCKEQIFHSNVRVVQFMNGVWQVCYKERLMFSKLLPIIHVQQYFQYFLISSHHSSSKNMYKYLECYNMVLYFC